MSDFQKDLDTQKSLLDYAFSSNTGILAGVGGAAYVTGKYGKRAVARGVNTLGFGNVEGSYASNPKLQQYLDDLYTSAEGKRRKMLNPLFQTLRKGGIPAELSAANQSIRDLEVYMSKLKSTGKKVPKKLIQLYQNSLSQLPEREMAQAIIQRSMNQPINFKHGGKIIEGTMPQNNPYIAKALEQKGMNIKNPIPVMDVSGDKFMVKKLRVASTGDPRLQYITKLMKAGLVDEALSAAKNGKMMYKGEVVSTGKSVELVRDGKGNWVTKYVPQYFRGGKLHSVKEYVVGGHTQMTTFGKYAGHKGFHKYNTTMFDITTYRSAGETLKTHSNPLQKLRVLAAGPVGQKLGIHTPVVTKAEYQHRAPGAGRPAQAKDKVKRKTRKFVESGLRTYSKAFDLAKKYGPRAALYILSKGKAKL